MTTDAPAFGPPFDLPAPTLILVGAGTQTLPGAGPHPARDHYCAPLTAARLEVAEARGRAYRAPVRIVTRAGLVHPDALVSGPELPLLEEEEIELTITTIKTHLEMYNISIVELHMSPHLEGLVMRSLSGFDGVVVTRPRLKNENLSGAFAAYKPQG